MKIYKPPRWIDRLTPSFTWRFSVSEPTIFLTFDDGPHPDVTPFILDELAKRNWKATFFCVGENVKRYPEIVARIEREGHQIGNHTMHHLKGTQTKTEAYLENMRAFEQIKSTRLFRPPYGRILPKQAREIAKTHQIIMWSWLSYDYDLSHSDQKILDALQHVKKGDILVFHDNFKIASRQKQLIPAAFDQLEKEGFHSATMPFDV